MFRNNDQQDAQEFLEFLLDGLHEDLNPNANRTKLQPLSEEEEQRRERMPSQKASNLEWDRYLHQNSSVVVNWLQGQLRSRLKCLTCSVTSTTYNPFMYLSLPIPSHTHVRFTLDDCLREFVKEEILEKDDAWNCPQCKVPRRSTKTLTIMRLPIILIIHLKRFTNKGRWRDKLTTTIQFPLRELDLSQYAPALLAPQSQANGVSNQRAELTPPFTYNVYGIVNHYGSLNSGHYTAVVRNAQKETWTLFDDSRVSGIDETQVVVSSHVSLLLLLAQLTSIVVSKCICSLLGP
jgi:ubiquitin carboxyl-terminal hydrolase 8